MVIVSLLAADPGRTGHEPFAAVRPASSSCRSATPCLRLTSSTWRARSGRRNLGRWHPLAGVPASKIWPN